MSRWERFKSVEWSRLISYVVTLFVLIYVINDLYGIVETPHDTKVEHRVVVIHRPANHAHGSSHDAAQQGGGGSSGASSPSSLPSPSPSAGGGGTQPTGTNSPAGDAGTSPTAPAPTPAPEPTQPPSVGDQVGSTIDGTLDTVCSVTNPLTGVCIKP